MIALIIVPATLLILLSLSLMFSEVASVLLAGFGFLILSIGVAAQMVVSALRGR